MASGDQAVNGESPKEANHVLDNADQGSPAVEVSQSVKEIRPSYGVESETCSSKMLGLSRFQSDEKFYRRSEKSETEALLNPFGDPWSARKPRNRFISTMTGSLLGYTRKQRGAFADPLCSDPDSPLPVSKAYKNYSSHSTSDFHYDETICRLAREMPAFHAMRDQFKQHGIQKRFIGYAVLNYDDHFLFSKPSGLPEDFYMHKPEESRRPEDRIKFRDGTTLVASGDVFDIRKTEVRSRLCDIVAATMDEHDVDGVLVDYAVRRFAFGAPGLIEDLPADWFENFQKNQHRMIAELYEKVSARGRLLFLNGVMLDSITVTKPELINLYLKVCHGMFWEQPFRWEWRTFHNGEQDYYQRLEQFFRLAEYYKKFLIVKCGTYRFHATEDIDTSWTSRFIKTDHGIERHLAAYLSCFYLLFQNRHYSRLYYTHPTELFDIFASEPFFDIWDKDIGEPLTGRIEYSPHVQVREFERAIVFVNNTLKSVRISPRLTPGGISRRLPRKILPPLSGTIWIKTEARASILMRLLKAHIRKRISG
jgi:hypothetical protein